MMTTLQPYYDDELDFSLLKFFNDPAFGFNCCRWRLRRFMQFPLALIVIIPKVLHRNRPHSPPNILSTELKMMMRMSARGTETQENFYPMKWFRCLRITIAMHFRFRCVTSFILHSNVLIQRYWNNWDVQLNNNNWLDSTHQRYAIISNNAIENACINKLESVTRDWVSLCVHDDVDDLITIISFLITETRNKKKIISRSEKERKIKSLHGNVDMLCLWWKLRRSWKADGSLYERDGEPMRFLVWMIKEKKKKYEEVKKKKEM